MKNDFKELQVENNQRVLKDSFIGVSNDGTKITSANPCIVKKIGKKIYLVNVDQDIYLRNGSELKVKKNDFVQAGKTIAVFDLFAEPIICEYSGTIQYQDIIPGSTMREEINEDTGKVEKKIVESTTVFNPNVKLVDDEGKVIVTYSLPFNSYLTVDNGEKVSVGKVLAKLPRSSVKTRDITGGLPKISKLFEAFNSREFETVLSKIDGTIKSSVAREKNRQIVIEDEFGKTFPHLIPLGRHLFVREGDTVKAGDRLCEGEVNTHDILDILGESALQAFLINEIQEVYRLQGVNINDKHIGVIVRQMMRNIEIVLPGDTYFIRGKLVDKFKFLEENRKIVSQGGEPAIAKPCLLGVKKASVNSESFLSAASFQETTKVLTSKAIEGVVDNLVGLKENIILGQLIPAGTGTRCYRNVELYDQEFKNLDDKVEKILQERELEKEQILQTEKQEEQSDISY